MRLSIKTKLLGIVALLIALMAVVGFVGMRGTTTVADEAHAMYTHAAVPLADMGVARAKLNENRAFLNNHMLERSGALPLSSVDHSSMLPLMLCTPKTLTHFG